MGTEDTNGGLIDPEPIRKEIDIKVTQLMDLNQRITSVLRRQAKDFEAIGGTYSALSHRAYEVSELIGELAVVAAHNTGDIIIAEFGLEGDDDEEDIDEDDGED